MTLWLKRFDPVIAKIYKLNHIYLLNIFFVLKVKSITLYVKVTARDKPLARAVYLFMFITYVTRQ